MAGGNGIFNRNPPDGRFAKLDEAHNKGREKKVEKAVSSSVATWQADARPGAAQATQRPLSYADLTRQHEEARKAAAWRDDLARQMTVNAAAVGAERHGTAAATPAKPMQRDAEPIAQQRPGTPQRGAPQPSPGGTTMLPAQHAVRAPGNVYAEKAKQPQAPSQPKVNPFGATVTKEQVAKMAGLQKAQEKDRGQER